MPIYIDSDLKKELEKSFIGEPIKKSYGSWNDFTLDIKTYDFDKPKCQYIDMGPIFDKSTSVKFFNLNNEYLKHKKFTISSHVDVANPSIFLRRNTILTFHWIGNCMLIYPAAIHWIIQVTPYFR